MRSHVEVPSRRRALVTTGMRRLVTAVVAALWLVPCLAMRSCTRNGQGVVPCADELLLDRGDRFLLTLFGHSCYNVQVNSANPLDVYFYDTNAWTKMRTAQRGGPTRGLRAVPKRESRDTAMVLNWQEEMKICNHSLECSVTRANQSAVTVYDLVIARSVLRDSREESADTRVFLQIASCAAVSKWFYVSLAATALGGFLTMMFLLCIISEYLLGVHAFTKLLHRISAWRRRRQHFVELAQMDSSEHKHPSKVKPYSTSVATSATGDPNDYSDDEADTESVPVDKHPTEGDVAVPHAF